MKRLTSFSLVLGLVTAPLPAFASPPEAAPDAAPASEATVGGNVAMLGFTGDPVNSEGIRGKVSEALQVAGYTAVNLKQSLTIGYAADKNKCRNVDAACLEKIGVYLNKNAKTPFDFFVYGEVPATGTGKVVVYDIAKQKIVREVVVNVVLDDYILPEVVGGAVARALTHYQVPPTPATDEEKAILATLDEPEKTAEEIDAEAQALADAEEAARKNYKENLQVGEQAVDLRADFKDYCRTGPREDREVQMLDGTVKKERDLRPVCKRGPVFGYWQPRAWVAMTLTIGSAAAMGAMYGLAAAAHGNWKDADAKLKASGLSATDPNNRCDGDVCYEDLAGQVSEAGTQIRRRAIIGDVLLGSTVLLAGVFAIIIYQDRDAAKKFIASEKELKALSDLRIGPWSSDGASGAGLGFKF
ncbi:hypothetical protein ACNOYE_28405 [Nannocystaceae bacterium ST9]